MKATKGIVICALFVSAVLMGVFCIQSVTTPIKFEQIRAEREVEVIKHLVDLRTAEVEFYHNNGRYIADGDSLILFLKTTPKKEVLKEGSLTDKQLENGLTEHQAVKIIDKAKRKALRDKKLSFESETDTLLYAYIWANDPEIKKNNLQGFRRDTIELNMIETLYKGEYDENNIGQLLDIPFSDNAKFEFEVDNAYKTDKGIHIPLLEVRASYESYLGDLNKQELVNLIDREQKLEHFPGLKVGDIYAPNNNAGNWE